MKSGYIKVLLLLMVFSLLLTCITYAEPAELQTEQNEQTNEQTELEQSSENQTRESSSANPFPAYLGVAAVSYAAPSSVTGHAQETVPANTNIWIVEKVFCVDDGNYYYYAGYGYNSASHRGYFCENVVYYNGSVLNHSNISDEYAPADYKAHSSLPGTVYDGPGTSYSVMGSVEQETVKLIRTDGDYNFIEYTVTGTGKIKRGYLHYSKITGSWGYLTSLVESKFNGQTFYLKNADSFQYLDVKSWSTAENGRLHQYEFHGDPNQIFKFTYNSEGQYFTIQPANNYVSNRRLAINHASNTATQEDKHLAIKTTADDISQRFWIVQQTGGERYKLVTVASYGTMTLTVRHDASGEGFVNQFYTSTDQLWDIWYIEPTEKRIAIHYPQPNNSSWCWLASAKTMASCEDGFNSSISLGEACNAVFGNSSLETGGNHVNTAQAANFFVTGDNIHSNHFGSYTNKIFTESDIRKFINADHAISMHFLRRNYMGHVLTLVKFKWVDNQGETGSPGHYNYYYSDPWEENYMEHPTRYDFLIKFHGPVPNGVWQRTIAYNCNITKTLADCMPLPAVDDEEDNL